MYIYNIYILNSGIITTMLYKLKFHVLRSSGKWFYILENTLLISKLYLHSK